MNLELCELIGLHSNSNSNQLHPGPLDQSTTSLLQCILKVSEKTAGDLLYSPHPPPQHHHHECMLYADDAIDNALLGRVVASGYAALPVYDRILNQQETKQEAVIGTITASKVRKKEKKGGHISLSYSTFNTYCQNSCFRCFIIIVQKRKPSAT